jgi:hypothetical protein
VYQFQFKYFIEWWFIKHKIYWFVVWPSFLHLCIQTLGFLNGILRTVTKQSKIFRHNWYISKCPDYLIALILYYFFLSFINLNVDVGLYNIQWLINYLHQYNITCPIRRLITGRVFNNYTTPHNKLSGRNQIVWTFWYNWYTICFDNKK